MSNPTDTPAAGLNRRGLLGALGGVAAAGALPAKALPAAEPHALIAEVRRLHARHQALIGHEMSIEAWEEGEPGRQAYEAAIAATKAAHSELYDLCNRILEQPVRTWGDVAVRAEMAKAFADEEFVENPCDMGEETLAALLEAALIMGGANV